MAKKKVEFVAEVPDKEEELDYKEIHETKVEDIVGTPTPEEPKEVKEEPKVEPEEKKEEGVDFDPDALTQKISEETAKRIIEATTKKEEPKVEVDEELISPWAKEGRAPKDYEEITDWAIKKAKILDKREAEAEALKQEEVKKQTEEYNKAQIEQFNKYTDEQLSDLKAAGKIKTADEQKALFQKMLEVNQARAKEGKSPIYSVKEIFYEHYTPPTAQPAGADAPISPGASTVESESKEINYLKDVRPGVPIGNFIDSLFRK